VQSCDDAAFDFLGQSRHVNFIGDPKSCWARQQQQEEDRKIIREGEKKLNEAQIK